MRTKILPALLPDRFPRLDWIQIEITTHCNGDCLYCPRSAWRSHWQARHLPPEIYEKLLPTFHQAGLVHLQGWGEPLTHPGFLSFLKRAKQAGARVGTTTNGTRITSDTAERLVDSGLDLIAFSLAGLENTNDTFRGSGTFNAVRQAIDRLQRAKAKYGVKTPAIHLAYMLLRSGLEEIERLPAFMNESGAVEAVVSSLSLIVRPALTEEARLAESGRPWKNCKDRLHAIRQEAAAHNRTIACQLVSPEPVPPRCSENIGRALVVNASGTVSPCVMTGLPVPESRCQHYVNHQPQAVINQFFGNLTQNSLSDIWRNKEYRRFRRAVLRSDFPPACRTCAKRFLDPVTPENKP